MPGRTVKTIESTLYKVDSPLVEGSAKNLIDIKNLFETARQVIVAVSSCHFPSHKKILEEILRRRFDHGSRSAQVQPAKDSVSIEENSGSHSPALHCSLVHEKNLVAIEAQH